MDVGQAIRKLRLSKGFTQQQVAIRLKISRNAYIAWETNQVALTVNRLMAICAIYSISIIEFFEPGGAPAATPPSVTVCDLPEQFVEDNLNFIRQQNKTISQLNKRLGKIMKDMSAEGSGFPGQP